MSEISGIILQGGLGNRLFQIAFIYSYGKKWNKIITISKEEHNPHSKINYHQLVYPFIQKNLFINNPFLFYEPEEKCISYLEIPNITNCIFRGYFQCDKYFNYYKNDLISFFRFPMQTKYITDNSIFLHIRRGDYLQKDFHKINLSKYYDIAIKYLKSKYNNFLINIISDEIEYCKSNKLFQNLNLKIEYIEGLNELETINLMQNCSLGGICVNSTFSWWGGYLSNIERIIFFPSKWFNNDTYENDIAFKDSYIIDIENHTIFKK